MEYFTLEKIFSRISKLSEVSAIIGWDSATTMPDGAAQARAEQISELGIVIHEIITDKKVGELIKAAKDKQDLLNSWQIANLKLIENRYIHSNAVPAELVEKLSLACSESEFFWRTAKRNNDYAGFKPYFSKVIELSKQVADIKSDILSLSPYDTMLDMYDMGRTSAELDIIFADLEDFLPSFTNEVIDNQKPFSAVKGDFPIEIQKQLFHDVIEKIGFDFKKGRLDESSHPFCGGVPSDIRITTRYKQDEFASALMGVIHETGHAMYEAGLPEEYRYQPVGQCNNMTMHESQSLFLEMQISRTTEFIKFLKPILEKYFGNNPLFEESNLYRSYTAVEKGFIRVDADEVTYPLHIILRYKLEKMIINEGVSVDELPEIWNEEFKKLFGMEVPDYSKGIMQDIHWPDGAFGYFPSYTMGALLAAQLKSKITKDIPNLTSQIESGNFKPMFEWLRKNFHAKGSSLLSSDAIAISSTGYKISTDAFKEYLTSKYKS